MHTRTPAKHDVLLQIREHRLLSLSKHVARAGHRACQEEQSRPSRLAKNFIELVIAGANKVPLLDNTPPEACVVHAGLLGTSWGQS